MGAWHIPQLTFTDIFRALARLPVAPVAIVMLVLLPAPCAQASEGGFGTYPVGFQDVMAGYLPPPGFYFKESAEFYTGSATRVVREGLVETNLQLTLPIQFTILNQVTKSKLWGSYCSWVLVVPIVEPTIEGQVPTANGPAQTSGSASGFSELYIMPLMLGWHNGRSHQKAWVAFYAPTGHYDINSFVNTNLNRWAVELDYAYTFRDPKTGYEFDVAPGYTINKINPETQYRCGQELHIDFAALKHLSPIWGLGAVGYAFIQTTPDSGSGAELGAFQGRTFALGPIVTYSSKVGDVPVGLTGKYYGEFGVSDRFAGHSYWLNLTASF